MKKLLCSLIVVVFLTGCVSKDLVLLSMDTSNLQRKVSTRLIEDINKDLADGNDSELKVKNLTELKIGLDFLMRMNDVIYGNLSGEMSAKELAQILKERNKYIE